ncbi:MAG: hypothetical protein ACPGR2_04305 [Psychrobium sp.]
MIKFSFVPLKKLSAAQLNDIDYRVESEEIITLASETELVMLMEMFDSNLTKTELAGVDDVGSIWLIDKKLKPQTEASIDSFYNQWLAKSKRDNDFGEFCQLVSFNSFISALNKGKVKVVMALT